MLGGNKKYLSFLDAFIACLILVALGICFKSIFPSAYQDVLLYPILKFLMFGIIVYGAVKLRKLDSAYLFPRKKYKGRTWCLVLITMSLYLLGRIATDIIELLRTNGTDFIKSREAEFYGFQSRGVRHFISLMIVGPIMEEILFRGLILRSFLTRYGTRKSIILSSLLFASLHVLNPEKYLLPTFIVSFCFAAFMAWVVIKTENIKNSILCHMVWNLTTYILLPFTFMTLGVKAANMTDVIAIFFGMSGFSLLLLYIGISGIKREFSA